MVENSILKEKYVSFYGVEACPPGEVLEIEKKLNVTLPTDFKEISRFYSGGLLGGISHFSIASGDEEFNVVSETLRLRRAVGLNSKYVALAEPAGSLILLNVSQGPGVVWCDALDIDGLEVVDFSNFIEAWDSYELFFQYLLEQERLERGGEGS